jgi:hypothetical protein
MTDTPVTKLDSVGMTPWPIDDRWGNKLTVFYAKYDANERHPAGVMIFTVADWNRGDDDILCRAKGMCCSRNVTKLVRVGTCSQDFQQQCYPNIESAEMRWGGIGKELGRDV